MSRLPKTEMSKIDFVLLFTVFFLVILGAAVVYSASSFKAENQVRTDYLSQAQDAQAAGDIERAERLRDVADQVNGSSYYIKKQAVKIVIGLFVMLLAALVHHERWLGLSPLFLVVAVGFLILLYMPLSNVIAKDEARRWFSLFGFTFQPSDFARYALVLVLARFLHEFREQLANLKTFLIFLSVITAVVLLVAFEKDLGTAIMIALISFTMMYLAGAKLRHLGTTFLTFVACAMIYLRLNGYMEQRVIDYLKQLMLGGEPSFQIKQSLISFAQGGSIGLGLGNSVQKFEFLPEAYKDMVFSIIGEEMGFVGAVGVLILFTMIFVRGMHIARTSPSGYGRLLAAGITACITWYAFLNAAVTLSLVPTTGIPMPFISYGGSALISHLGAIGILLNISTFTNEAVAKYEQESTYKNRLNKWSTQGSSRTRKRATGASW